MAIPPTRQRVEAVDRQLHEAAKIQTGSVDLTQNLEARRLTLKMKAAAAHQASIAPHMLT